MTPILNEKEVLSKVKNPLVLKLYKDFFDKTGLSINFENFIGRVRAESKYQRGSEIFTIKLGENWVEADVAHELTHGQLMFLDNYPIIRCDKHICQLIGDYMTDILVYERLYRLYNFIPADKNYLADRKRWTRALFKGESLQDSYWDKKGDICNKLHKAFVYIQAWHFNILNRNIILFRFLESYRRRYKKSKELLLAQKIQEIIRTNKMVSNKELFENALNEIVKIEFLELTDVNIMHFNSSDVGYRLL